MKLAPKWLEKRREKVDLGNFGADIEELRAGDGANGHHHSGCRSRPTTVVMAADLAAAGGGGRGASRYVKRGLFDFFIILLFLFLYLSKAE